MNAMERIREAITAAFPDVSAVMEPPAADGGTWNLDFKRGGEFILYVEWKAGSGFGISTPKPDDFGSKPDEFYRKESLALGRIIHLIVTGGSSIQPASVQLAELRRMKGLTQAQLAERAGITQPAVARLEGQEDARMSTLAKVANALGGTLSVRMKFPPGDDLELRFPERLLDAPNV